VEKSTVQKLERFLDEQPIFVAPELVSKPCKDDEKLYYCYVIELSGNFAYDVPVQDIILGVRNKFDVDNESFTFDLEFDRGIMGVHIKYIGGVRFGAEQVILCQKFQAGVLTVLLDNDLVKLNEVLNSLNLSKDTAEFDYLLLPFTSLAQKSCSFDWKSMASFLWEHYRTKCSSPNCKGQTVQTKNGLTCLCMLENCLLHAPHNDRLYCTAGILHDLNANSDLRMKDGKPQSYKQYFKEKQGIDLKYLEEPLINGRQVFTVQNHLHKFKRQKQRKPVKSSIELPAELCSIIMSPVSITMFYTFSFIPSIMHRIESLLVASNLRKICLDNCTQNVVISTYKVMEAITTKKCQERFHLESMGTLGDSFLKYAVSQQLFKDHPFHHEGLLTVKKEKFISNAALCKLSCDMKLTGFIRNEPFDPKTMIIPGNHARSFNPTEEYFSETYKLYISGRRKVKGKVAADVLEALIGAFLSCGGELAAIQFMNFVGIKVHFNITPYEKNLAVHPERLINIPFFESLLNYKFRDASLLVEAMTHGSYMLPEIPRCYQRLEFLGDAVLDYMMTMHLYEEHPGLSPGLLTDLRSASVNNDCYAQSVIKAALHKHILHASQELHRQLIIMLKNFESSSSASPQVPTFGWDCEIKFPKVLGDIIESIAGAILVDSDYNKDVVFKSIRPLLEPLVTPQTLKPHPIRELTDLCQKNHFLKKKPQVSSENGVSTLTIEIDANGVIYKYTSSASDKQMAKKIASKNLLKMLKEKAIGN
jgi:endoribonuclease Dicer